MVSLRLLCGQLLLNDKEEMYVRLMYSELLKRGALDDERFYFTAPKNRESIIPQMVN